MTETTAVPAVTGFHHFSATVSDAEASAHGRAGLRDEPAAGHVSHYGDKEGGYASPS